MPNPLLDEASALRTLNEGPLAIEKSNFLIEPIDTPFSSSSLRTTAAAVPGLCMSGERRMMTWLHFPPASAVLDLSIWIQCGLKAQWREWKCEDKRCNCGRDTGQQDKIKNNDNGNDRLHYCKLYRPNCKNVLWYDISDLLNCTQWQTKFLLSGILLIKYPWSFWMNP